MLRKPVSLVLSGQPLPYVKQVTHLGHKFHEDGTMDTDTNIRRGIFIGHCLEVQESLSFAAPLDVLGAIKLYCGDLYGGILTCLDIEQVALLTNSWNTAVKDVWGLPRSTHRVYTKWLSSDHTSLREDLASCWPNFF